MQDRRKYDRFQLKLPARLEIKSAQGTKILELQTKDISAAGTLLLGNKAPFSTGARCNLELIVTSEKIEELTGAKGLIKVGAIIVRNTPDGVAISFDGDCQIFGLKGS
jgi:hypothetical protein